MQAEVLLKQTIDYLSGHLPGFAELIVKIVICALIYVIGKKLIAKLVRVVRAMLDKSHVSPGAATFVVSMLKIILYLTLILGIAMQFGLKESSVAALVASGGVAIGLALQGGLSNLAGGFLILLFQLCQIGDYITFYADGSCIPGSPGSKLRINACSVINKIDVKARGFDFFRRHISGQLVNNGAYHLQMPKFFCADRGSPRATSTKKPCAARVTGRKRERKRECAKCRLAPFL